MPNITPINLSAKKTVQKLKGLLPKKLKNKAPSNQINSLNTNALVQPPYYSEINSISKLRTPQMKFFAESKLGLDTKIEILTTEYSKIFYKQKLRNNLITNKIKKKIKDKLDSYSDFGLNNCVYILNVEDAKYRTIIKTSLIIALGNLSIISMNAMNIFPFNQNNIFTLGLCAFDAVMIATGLHKYSKLQQEYYEEDVHDLLYILKQKKNHEL